MVPCPNFVASVLHELSSYSVTWCDVCLPLHFAAGLVFICVMFWFINHNWGFHFMKSSTECLWSIQLNCFGILSPFFLSSWLQPSLYFKMIFLEGFRTHLGPVVDAFLTCKFLIQSPLGHAIILSLPLGPTGQLVHLTGPTPDIFRWLFFSAPGSHHLLRPRFLPCLIWCSTNRKRLGSWNSKK